MLRATLNRFFPQGWTRPLSQADDRKDDSLDLSLTLVSPILRDAQVILKKRGMGMVEARRAAAPDDEILVAAPADADSAVAKRGVVANTGFVGSKVLKRLIAPLALAGIVVGGAVTLNRTGQSTAVADPVAESTDLGVSRNMLRQQLSSPSASASASSEAPSVAPSPTETASPSPTPTETETAASETTASATPSAKTTATKSASPSPSSASVPPLGSTAGTKYATQALNVRSGPGTDFDLRVTLKPGAEVTVTDVTQGGWQQIVYKDKAGWVKSSYLTDSKPQASETPTPSPTTGASCESSSAKSIESGLTSKTVSVLRKVCATFPNVKSYGGYRNDSGYHGQGRAIDIMISGEDGWVIAKWARANAKELGVIEVIYSQKIWTTQRSSDGWRSMSDRGSATANHYDHVHLSIGG